MLSLAGTAWSDSFQSRIYKIENSTKRGLPHLVKFENGRVAFVAYRDTDMLESLESNNNDGDVIELIVDDENDVVSAMTVENGTGPLTPEQPRSETSRNEARSSYVPTVVKGLTAAKNIFARMKRNWQNDSQCYNRAHIWTHEEYERSGLNSIKLFLFFTSRYIRNYRYKWWFHVSPMIMVKEGSTVNRRVIDRRYTSGPHFVKSWTDIFIKSKRNCPVVSKYSQYNNHQQKEDCFLMPMSQYYWQPRDIQSNENTGYEKTSYIAEEVDWAYEEAF